MQQFEMRTRPSGDPRTREKLKLKSVKPKRWSHQDELDAGKGRVVNLVLDDGSTIWNSTLLEADQFSIKIRTVGAAGKVIVVFKSAISTFEIVHD